MAEASKREMLELKLKTLTFKKEYLFTKVQRLYDFSRTVKDDPNNMQSFLAQFSELESVRTKFENNVLEIYEINMQLKPSMKLSTSELDAFDALYNGCSLAARTFQTMQSDLRHASEQKSSELVRPSLPKLTLFEFDGQIENWTTFYDTFYSLVHSRNFAEIDKFHYLLSCVKGTALNIVKNLPITAANYSLVWQSLLEKYQDNRALAGRYLDKMLNFTPLHKDTNSNLTLFIETFDHSLKAIQALKIDNLDDYLFCHLALRGLDIHTRKLFEESRDQKSIPKFSELIDFVNKQIKVLEHTFPSSSLNSQPKSKPTSNNNYNYKGSSNSQNNSRQPSSKSVLTTARMSTNDNYNKNNLCPNCKENHMIYRCEHFRKMSVDARIDRVNSLKLCINCLKSNHVASSCRSNITCGVCALPHHYLLHKDSGRASASCTAAVPARSTAQLSPSNAQQALVSSHSVSGSQAAHETLHSVDENQYGVVLGTTRTNILDVNRQFQDCRAVIDSGAQSSFITTECAQRLGLPRRKCPFSISGLGGEFIKNQGMVTCTMKPRFADGPIFTLNMVVVTKVSSDMPNVNFPENVISEYKRFKLADPFYYKRSRVDILLGNDIVPDIIQDKPLLIDANIPSVIQTVFGYVISGKLYPSDSYFSQNLHFSVCCDEDQSLDRTLRSFWEIEEVPCTPSINPLEQLAEDIYTNEHTRDASGTYVVPLPFVPNHPPLGDSRTVAERRLSFTERKLARTPRLHQAYSEFMRDYENLGHMELYNGSDSSKYIIPHHSILRPSSSSTPLRVVFDASAKSSNNVSLNDILLTGPTLYRDIGAIILNFRLFEYCLVCDVCKMYRCIKLKESDRCYQHILYRKSLSDNIKLYELKTVTYGLSCSPFLAIRTLIQLSRDEGKRFPLAARVIQDGVYMDDVLYSCPTFEQACAVQDQLIGIFKSGNFELKKWTSNNAKLLNRVPLENRECPITFMKDGNECTIKVLGLTWTPLSDNFLFSVMKTDHVSTKRSVLKLLASIYDPVGFIAPCTFVAKQIMQDLWKLGIGWDEQLPPEISNRWANYIADLPRLAEMPIERHMLLPDQTECELVGFCDASSLGYAACVYVISRDDCNNVKVRLVTAKSKVAPIKPMTIPRLELMGAVLLTKLLKFICDNLTRVKINRITALTDSTIVLSWLQTEAYKLKTFVCNRVTQIVEVVPSHYWRHVSSENNLADICSRGVFPAQLVCNSKQWLLGAQWLYNSYEEWPISVFSNENASKTLELKFAYNLLTQNNVEHKMVFCERIFTKFSSFSKLQRCFAWMLRWRIKPKKLSPFLGDLGFLRVGGHITHFKLPYHAKHPRLLHKDSYFTRLLIAYYLKNYLHIGPRTLQGIIKDNFIVHSAVIKFLTFEELYTVFCKVEAILNSRPLCPLPASDSPDDFNVLTAGHFLIGKNLTAVPEYNIEDVPMNRLSRWQYIQQSSQLFWKRWSREYLNTLQQRAKWFISKPNLKIGDLVVIKTDNTPPCNWPLGRIEALHPGPDGVVRCVTLRTEKSVLQRPVNKLSPLPYIN